ncbi:MAG: hypothetical protein ABR595_10570, partial [Psychroflexus sp.]
DTHSASADIIINVKNLSLPQNTLEIILDKKKLPTDNVQLIKSYFLPAIHDHLAYLLTQFQDNSCISKAVKLCGKGNVKFIDINIFGNSCALECE